MHFDGFTLKKFGFEVKNREKTSKNQKKLAKRKLHDIIYFVIFVGVSPSGKATDSDSVIPRFES